MLNSSEYYSKDLFDDQSSSNFSNTESLFHDSSINMNSNQDITHLINTNEQQFSQQMSRFHFILNALPSSSTRIHEETTTYLNQGQPYEIKFHINKIKTENSSISPLDYSVPITYRSIIRLCFWDKTLQTQEYDLIQKWLNEYHSSSLFDIDMNLTYGILSIIGSKQIPNAVEIVWDTSTTTSTFIRFKCTSTDFAQKRHGGEKGIPLRLQIDTYHENLNNQIEHIHSCCCKIQLFRLKGAQRKNKADKLKLEKLNFDQRRQYQMTFEYTILQSCAISPLYTLNLLSLSQPPDDLFNVCTTPTIEENLLIQKNEIETKEKTDQHEYTKSFSTQLSNIPSKITIQSTNDDVITWLTTNHFSSLINRFEHYTGLDLLRLTKANIRQICNNDDAISLRLYNRLNETLIPPLKTFYIRLINNDTYFAIYLHTLTRYELKEKLFQLIELPFQESLNMILELNRIKIKIDNDNVVKYSLPNEGQFYLKIFSNEFILCLINRSN